MNKRSIGSEWENKAVEYLKSCNIKILEQNYRCRMGEIDIIGMENKTYVFVEVKYRSSARYGLSYEAVTPKKQSTIVKVAQYYLINHNIPTDSSVRFDVCGFDSGKLTYIKAAF